MPCQPYAKVELGWIVLLPGSSAVIRGQIKTSQRGFTNHSEPIVYVSVMNVDLREQLVRNFEYGHYAVTHMS